MDLNSILWEMAAEGATGIMLAILIRALILFFYWWLIKTAVKVGTKQALKEHRIDSMISEAKGEKTQTLKEQAEEEYNAW